MNVASLLVRAWQILAWKHWARAVGISVLVAVQMPVQTFDTNWCWAPWRVLYNIPWYLFYGAMFLMAIVLVESSSSGHALPSVWR